MAGDGKSKDGRRASPNERTDAQARSLQGANAPPRDKPVIEGEVIKAETRESPAAEGQSQESPQEPSKASSETSSQDSSGTPPEPELVAALAAPTESVQSDATDAENTTATVDTAPPQVHPATQHVSLWPIAVAILVGALIAVGGAYVLHSMDDVPKSLAAYDSRLSVLEHRPAPTPLPTPQVDESRLDKRIGTLESGVQSTAASLTHLQQNVQHLVAAQKQSETALEQAQTELKQVAQDASAKIAAPTLPPVDLAPLTTRVGKLQDRLGKFEDRLASLDQRLDTLVAKFDDEMHKAQVAKDHWEQVATARAAANAVAIIAIDLRRKVEAGVAFEDDLAALANHGVDKSALARLDPVAATGVASPAALAKQFAAVESDILATQPGPKKADGFLSRLAQDAAHLVRIRKIGDMTGDDLPARVARIDAALKAGHVEAALREWNDLPDAAKAKSKAFGVATQQRIDALGAAKTIEASALTTLAKVKS